MEIFYQGSSMHPVFQPGDRMTIVPCCQADIRRGDIIVFMPPGGNKLVVHRVLSTGPDGVRTMADCGHQADPWILNLEQIRGRVVSFKRGKARYTVLRSFAGRVRARLNRSMAMMEIHLADALHPLYHWLSRKGAFRWMLSASMKQRVVTFERPDGKEIQILMGNRVVGRYVAGAGWMIKRPYRLFLDETKLPR